VAEASNLTAVKFLLQNGADATMRDAEGKMASMVAEDPSVVAALGGNGGAPVVAAAEAVDFEEDDDDDDDDDDSDGGEFGGFEDVSPPASAAKAAPPAVAPIMDDFDSDVDAGGDDFGGFDDPPSASKATPKAAAASAKRSSAKPAARSGAKGRANSHERVVRQAMSEVDERWWVGKQTRTSVNYLVVTHGKVGQFLVRHGTQASGGSGKGSQHRPVVIVMNDYGVPSNVKVMITVDGTAIVSQKRFNCLEDAVSMLQTSPMASKVPGKPEFVLGSPVRCPVAVIFNFMDFISNRLKCRKLPEPPTAKKEKSIKKGKAEKKAAAAAATSGDGGTKPADETDATKGDAQGDMDATSKIGRRRSSFFRRKPKAKEEPKEEDGAKVWTCPTYPVVRVAVAKRDSPGYGMTVVGPPDGAVRKTGVFISKVAPDGPAAVESEGKVQVGMRIVAMNGRRATESTRPEVVELMRSSVTAVMTLQMDPKGYARFDGGKMLKDLEAEWLAGEGISAQDQAGTEQTFMATE